MAMKNRLNFKTFIEFISQFCSMFNGRICRKNSLTCNWNEFPGNWRFPIKLIFHSEKKTWNEKNSTKTQKENSLWIFFIFFIDYSPHSLSFSFSLLYGIVPHFRFALKLLILFCLSFFLFNIELKEKHEGWEKIRAPETTSIMVQESSRIQWH